MQKLNSWCPFLVPALQGTRARVPVGTQDGRVAVAVSRSAPNSKLLIFCTLTKTGVCCARNVSNYNTYFAHSRTINSLKKISLTLFSKNKQKQTNRTAQRLM